MFGIRRDEVNKQFWEFRQDKQRNLCWRDHLLFLYYWNQGDYHWRAT